MSMQVTGPHFDKGESEGSVDLEELPPLPFCLDEIRHPIAGCLPGTEVDWTTRNKARK